MPDSPLPLLIIVADSPGALTELCGVSLVERVRRAARQIGFNEATVLAGAITPIREHLSAQTWRKSDVALNFVERTGGETVLSDLLHCAAGHDAKSGQLLIVPAEFCYDGRLLRALAEATTESVLIDSKPPPEVAILWEGSDPHAFGFFSGAALLSMAWLYAKEPGANFRATIAGEASAGRLAHVDAARQPGYVRSMRRELRPFFFPAPSPAHLARAERALIDATQKGALDFPALVHAPMEKFLAARLCRTSITPNQLTLATATLGLCVTALYFRGHLWGGVMLALIIGVLDGVDGKLARLKIQTTKLGKGEHILDYFVELSWWTALAAYFRMSHAVPNAFVFLIMLVVSDWLDRLARALVEPRLQRSLDDIAPFDRFVRHVAGRRNIYTWLFAFFLLLGMPARGFVLFCWWGMAGAAIHVVRALQIRFGPAFPR